jgi:hypothetical protein
MLIAKQTQKAWFGLFLMFVCLCAASESAFAGSLKTAQLTHVEIEKKAVGPTGDMRLTVRAMGFFYSSSNQQDAPTIESGSIHFVCPKGKEDICRRDWEEWKRNVHNANTPAEGGNCVLLGSSLSFSVVDSGKKCRCLKETAVSDLPKDMALYPVKKGAYKLLGPETSPACVALNHKSGQCSMPSPTAPSCETETTRYPITTRQLPQPIKKETNTSSMTSCSVAPPATGFGCSLNNKDQKGPAIWALLLILAIFIRPKRS